MELLTQSNVNSDHSEEGIVQDKIVFDFDKRDSQQTFNSVAVTDWKPGFWWDKMTFSMVEWDADFGEIDFKIGVGFNAKKKTDKGIELKTNGSVDYEIKFKSKVEDCGNAYFDYYENPNKWIYFTNYGFRIKVSEDNN